MSVLLPCVALAADVYKCTDADGKVSFASTPCDKGSKSNIVLSTPEVPATPTDDATDAGPRGMTWGVVPDAQAGESTLVSCSGEPRLPGLPRCDPYHGDTSCSAARPLLCISTEKLPRPNDLRHPPTAGAVPDPSFYSGWSGARLALSARVKGSLLQSAKQASAICERQFGAGWRMAEFHDGNVDREPISKSINDPSHAGETVAVRGGWGFFGAGRLPATARFWVEVNDQKANCWQ